MRFINIIENISKDFIISFNKRDFDKLANYLAPNFYIESENIQKVYPSQEIAVIKGAENAIQYLKDLVILFPDFTFDSSQHTIENKGKNIRYSGFLTNGKPYRANFIVNEYAKFDCLIIDYPESI